MPCTHSRLAFIEWKAFTNWTSCTCGAPLALGRPPGHHRAAPLLGLAFQRNLLLVSRDPRLSGQSRVTRLVPLPLQGTCFSRIQIGVSMGDRRSLSCWTLRRMPGLRSCHCFKTFDSLVVCLLADWSSKLEIHLPSKNGMYVLYILVYKGYHFLGIAGNMTFYFCPSLERAIVSVGERKLGHGHRQVQGMAGSTPN